jgi:Na+-driven multidrug efflux pump
VLTNMGTTCMMIVRGIQAAMSAIIGNSIGKGNIALVYRALSTIGVVVFGINLIIISTLYFLKDWLVELYTDQKDVQELLLTLIPYTCL